MAVSNSINYLDSVGMSIDAWIELPEDQKEQKLKELLSEKKPDELQETLNQLADDVNSEKENLKDLETKLRKELRSTSNLSNEQKNEVRKWLNKIDELQAELKDYQALASKEATDAKKHNIDISNGSDINVSQASLKLDGETYTYTISNSKGNPFGEEAKKNPLEGITSDGTATGKVIKDVDGVDGLNYGDIEAALKNAEQQRISESQKIFINTPEDYKWELATADRESGTYTFKVTNDKGESSYVTFENAKDAVFVFASGMSENDLSKIKNKWPTELLKNARWEGDEKSFYEHFNKSEISQETKNKSVSYYEETIFGITDAKAYAGYGQKDYTNKTKEYLDKLYATYSNNSEGGMTKAWNDIFKDMNDAGISKEDQNAILRHLVFTLATNDPEHFDDFMGIAASRIEQSLTIDESSSNDSVNAYSKACLLLLEALSEGSTQYGGIEATLSRFISHKDEIGKTVAGEWTDQKENEEALSIFKEVMNKLGKPIPEIITDFENIEKIEPIYFGEEQFNLLNASTSSDSGAVKHYGAVYRVPYNSGPGHLYRHAHNKSKIRANVENLWTELWAASNSYLENNGNKEVPVEVLADAFIKHFESGERLPTALPAALSIIKEKMPELFEALLKTPGFREKVWALFKDQTDSVGYKDVYEWLNIAELEPSTIYKDIDGVIISHQT